MSEKEVLDLLLLSESPSQKLDILRKIRNSVIGNRKRKKQFLSNQAIEILVETWNHNSVIPELVSELAVIISSLTLDNGEAVQALLECGGIELILKGLFSTDIALVASCLKALRSVYSVDNVSPNLLDQDNNVSRKLVALLLYPSPLNELSATVISKSCRTQDHQNFLLANGVISNLFALLVAPSPKVVSAGVQCLSTVIKDNTFTSSACINCIVPGCLNEEGTLLTLLLNLMTYSSSDIVKLNTSICIAQLFLVQAISSSEPILTVKLIPSLVGLCRSNVDKNIRIQAANTIYDLINDNTELQEKAATTDNLLSVLSEFFLNKPDEDDENTDELSVQLYNNLCKSAFRLLACLSSCVEDIRFQVINKSKVMHHVSSAIDSRTVDVRVAAMRCLLSLSRSPKLLRTYLSDTEVWKAVVRMLSSSDEECVCIACSLCCNLLHSFCPSREAMVIDGIVPTLAQLASHSNSIIQLNAVWALMNCCKDGSLAIIKQVRVSLPIEEILVILQSQQNNTPLVIKCLGLIMNLTQSSQESDILLEDYHGIIEVLSSVLTLSLSDEVLEQVLCTLVNLSSGCSRSRNRIAECETVTKNIAQILRTNRNKSVLAPCCKLIHNLADVVHDDHTHRQNCLEEAGVQHYLQKLEMIDDSQLQEMARQVLELLQTASL